MVPGARALSRSWIGLTIKPLIRYGSGVSASRPHELSAIRHSGPYTRRIEQLACRALSRNIHPPLSPRVYRFRWRTALRHSHPSPPKEVLGRKLAREHKSFNESSVSSQRVGNNGRSPHSVPPANSIGTRPGLDPAVESTPAPGQRRFLRAAPGGVRCTISAPPAPSPPGCGRPCR